MNKLSLGRYNENNNNEGSSLHKGLLLEEAKQFGFRGLQNATKEELNALVNGEVKTEEESQLLYKKIKQDIKERMSKKKVVEITNVLEMGLSDSELKIIEELNSSQHAKICDYYEQTFNSNYPEVNRIENCLDYDENGLEIHFEPSKKQLKWCEEQKRNFVDYINNEYMMNWNNFKDILIWITGSDNEHAPRNRKNVDIILTKIDIIDEPKLIVSTHKDNKDFQLKQIIDENGVMHIAKVYKINDNESFLTW